MNSANVQRITLGDLEIVRLVEWRGAFLPAPELVPDAPPELWRQNADWLVPDHWEPETDRAAMALQTWIVRGGGRTVVVDPGVGSGRERPDSPFHHWQGGFPGLLAEAGIGVEEVDAVVNTHLHVDHVGWNTSGVDGEWVPTFPHARYYFPAADDFHFGPANGYANGLREIDRLIYQDSVAPIHRAGQAVLWDGELRLDEHLTLESAPGHTPGSSVLRIASGGERAVLVGDLMHSPVQVLAPSCSSCLCLDPARAAVTRRQVLARAAELGELVIPAHFGGTGTVRVRPAGAGFALAD
ncbi:MBL fold metallo-hydrolase [Streptomyces tateyamensis]|uniref:MBL fold metallo-hydrolase n=1 Tax=Streptomyces tateyamensis TaxID=565073 RepID=A0A2V4NWU2_9ACTN|nr:MBL fold metallo-hydrolase [Streptomyces tateyamensis]PYC81341.1 MBL fold metallo-hydrolase [Streptomyces tateyamensis]